MSPLVLEAVYHVLSVSGIEGWKVYLAGPLKGLYDYQAFYDVARILKDAGATVTSPHEPDPGVPLLARLEANTSALLASDLVVLLEGWERAASATVDVMTAAGAGIPCVALADISI